MTDSTFSQAIVIADLLVMLDLADGFDTDGQWPVYDSTFGEKDGQPDGICVYNTEGILERRSLRTGHAQERYGIQIAIRSVDYVEGRKKARAIIDAFEEVSKLDVIAEDHDEVVTIQTISRKGSLIDMPEDEQQRRKCVVNFLVCI